MAYIIFLIAVIGGIYNLVVACGRDLFSDASQAYFGDHETEHRRAVKSTIRKQFIKAGICFLIAFIAGRMCM